LTTTKPARAGADAAKASANTLIAKANFLIFSSLLCFPGTFG
jgi:hypothetical protein